MQKHASVTGVIKTLEQAIALHQDERRLKVFIVDGHVNDGGSGSANYEEPLCPADEPDWSPVKFFYVGESKDLPILQVIIRVTGKNTLCFHSGDADVGGRVCGPDGRPTSNPQDQVALRILLSFMQSIGEEYFE